MAKETTIAKIDDDEPDLQAEVTALRAEMTLMRSSMKTGAGGFDPAQLEAMFVRVAQISADAQERAANPSNKQHPGKSVFSYPEGDLKRPRAFKCPMFWNGYDMQLSDTTALELELLNQAEPGTYTFTRTDGTPDTLIVTADRGPAGELSQLWFRFEAKERRDTLPSVTNLLRSAFHLKTPEQLELDALRAQLAAMQAASGAVQVSA